MKAKSFIFLLFMLMSSCQPERTSYPDLITKDIPLFWEAYDQIKRTDDTVLQRQYLQELFLDKGTIGLSTIMQVRNYQPDEYLGAIRNYPKYWTSVRESTLEAPKYAAEIQKGIDGFKKLYPAYRPAKVYFEIGVFRTPGTALDSVIMIGAEMAMGDENTVVEDLPESLDYVKSYLQGNPVQDLAFLNVHEYVHSQQMARGGYDLLSQSIFEGSAEFIAELVMKQASIQPSIAYGKANDTKVRERFIQEMFSPWYYNWIWNSTDNEFGHRDLGYYIGYAIVSKYYEQTTDKEEALRKIIELDYNDPAAIEVFAEEVGYFEQDFKTLKNAYEASRPAVVGFTGLEMNQQNVDPKQTEFTVLFSEPMDPRFRSTDFGPSGKDHFPKLETIVFAEDGLSATYQVKLKANTEYDMIIDRGYRNARAMPLQPFNLKFKTGR